jgi:hypothetical protein
MTAPTQYDATLLAQLAQWHRTYDLAEALRWLWSDGFARDFADFARLYPPGSEGDRMAALVCAYFEAVGTLYEHGLVKDDRLFDWFEVGPVWDRIRGYVLGQRRDANSRPLWPHFEALATAHKRLTREYST